MASQKVDNYHDTQAAVDPHPDIVDQRAKDKANAPYAECPVSTLTCNQGYRKITYGDSTNVTNGVALWLYNKPRQGRDFETLACIGPNDSRHSGSVLSAVKAGCTVLYHTVSIQMTALMSIDVPHIPSQQRRCSNEALRPAELRDHVIAKS